MTGSPKHLYLVCDSDAAPQLIAHLRPAFSPAQVRMDVTTGDDDGIDKILAARPDVIAISASLRDGDAKALVDVLRSEMPGEKLRIVLLGDVSGPIRTSLDAIDFAVDRFVAAPIAAKSLRFAVSQCLNLPVTLASNEGEQASSTGEQPAQLDFASGDGHREPTLILSDHEASRPHSAQPVAPTPAAQAAEEMWPSRPTPEVASNNSREPTTQPGARDFARELREKMSKMADRLFALPGGATVEVARSQNSGQANLNEDIDIAAFAEEPALPGHATEVITTTNHHEGNETAPGGWGVDGSGSKAGKVSPAATAGEIALGSNDAATLIARCHKGSHTGRLCLRSGRNEITVYFDQGKLVFAASSNPADRMGTMLLREGKLTRPHLQEAANSVAKTGRRIGETLVDLGYLKRRELLPGVRRHLEDVLFVAFGMRDGSFSIFIDPAPSNERIRISRPVLALLIEGLRRKYTSETLLRLGVGPLSVVELVDREKLAPALANLDLLPAERAAVLACDGSADIAALAQQHSLDVTSFSAVVYSLSLLGLVVVRRGQQVEDEEYDDTHALVGETDIAIDRARVVGRSQLVVDADYFALLGVRRDATAFEIKRAFDAAKRDFAVENFPVELRRELARELADISHCLEEAFWVLRDDSLRKSYLQHLVDPTDSMDRNP